MQVQSTITATQNVAVMLAASSEPVNSVTSQIACAHSVKRPIKKTLRRVKQLNRVNLRTFIVSQHGRFVSVALSFRFLSSYSISNLLFCSF